MDKAERPTTRPANGAWVGSIASARYRGPPATAGSGDATR